MKIAKASESDLTMAMDLAFALESLAGKWGGFMPEKIAVCGEDEAGEHFSLDDPDQCRRALEYLLKLVKQGSLFRVVGGMQVVLDPVNRVIDPDADTLEHHPDAQAGLDAMRAKPLDDWHEDVGPVLWWKFPIDEPPWCGTPLDSDWPGDHTHWTVLVCPDAAGGEG